MSDTDIKEALPQDRLIAEPFATDQAAVMKLQAGLLDHHPLVQAFIRHREAGAREAAGLSAEKLAENLTMGIKIARVTAFLTEHLAPLQSRSAEPPTAKPMFDKDALRHVLEILKS